MRRAAVTLARSLSESHFFSLSFFSCVRLSKKAPAFEEGEWKTFPTPYDYDDDDTFLGKKIHTKMEKDSELDRLAF